MRAKISPDGVLTVIPESETETYALRKFGEASFSTGKVEAVGGLLSTQVLDASKILLVTAFPSTE